MKVTLLLNVTIEPGFVQNMATRRRTTDDEVLRQLAGYVECAVDASVRHIGGVERLSLESVVDAEAPAAK